METLNFGEKIQFRKKVGNFEKSKYQKNLEFKKVEIQEKNSRNFGKSLQQKLNFEKKSVLRKKSRFREKDLNFVK